MKLELVRTRPAYHPFVVVVTRVEALSPSFRRITFSDTELAHFGIGGPDQRIKVVLPHDDGSFADFGQADGAGDWYDRWRALPDAERNDFRTYTVRSHDPHAREIVVDFVIHHGAGPAGRWAERAAVGDELVIVGPDARSDQPLLGFDYHPGSAQRILLAGDETAVPAILSIAESLPAHVEADVLLEVPTEADILSVSGGPAVRVRWCVRNDDDHGAGLLREVREWIAANPEVIAAAASPRAQVVADIDVDRELLWDAPENIEGEFYAWIAGEAATVKAARRSLVSDSGVDRRRVAFMGYWRCGQSERTQ